MSDNMPTLWDISIEYGQPIPDIGNRHVCCHVSGGAASAVAAMRCITWYGRDRVHLVYADTCSESDGNQALVDALKEASGLAVIRLSQDKDIWDVFDEHGVMRMDGACKASVELKQKPLDAYTQSRFSPDEVLIALGLSWDEPKRQTRLAARLQPYQAFFPLNAGPQMQHCELLAELAKLGLPESMAYGLGYQHDNCKGGCILAGQAQWAGLLDDDPEHFAYCERREWAFFLRTGFSVLKDRRGGKTQSYPLRQLRTDKAAGRTFRGTWRATCACMDSPVEEELDRLEREK